MVCQALLTKIILLNRRRSGEVQRIKLQDYLNRSKTKMQEEIHRSLTDVEAKLSEYFVRFVIRGKRGRGVPVLLTSDMKESLDLLIQIRNECNILESNEHIFAIPFTVVGVYRGSDCLRKAAIECKASSPDLLTSTKLRKHIATMSQLLNLTSNDKEQLANFMGHDLAIHNDYYKLPDETLQISRISKILLAMESGKVHELRGKTLEEFDDYIMPNDTEDEDEKDESEGNNDDSISKESSLTNQCDNESYYVPPTTVEDTKQGKKLIKRLNSNGKCNGESCDSDDSFEPDNKKIKVVTKSNRGDYVKWSESEINAVKRAMGKFIALHKIPQQHDCLLAIKNEPALKKRNWKKIKFQVANLIKKSVKQ
eukprot:XP_016663520.1 PREDICTED: uncharacterized protein LOC107884922 [Acyrthosiphon pisum]